MGRLQGVRVSTVFPAAVIQDVAAHMWTRVTDKALLDGSLRMPARECVDVAPLWDGDRPVAVGGSGPWPDQTPQRGPRVANLQLMRSDWAVRRFDARSVPLDTKGQHIPLLNALKTEKDAVVPCMGRR